jgi:alpha-tubulin suppressor-like RCC1 family protein
MTEKKDLRSELGRGAARFARAMVAGALACLAHTVAGQPVPNVVAWGTLINLYGEQGSGEGSLTGSLTAPIWATNVVAASVNFDHALAVRGDGTVLGWGFNSFGQTNIPPSLGNVLAVAAGADFSLVLQGAGTAVAWGLNAFGETNVPAGLTNAVAVAAYGATVGSFSPSCLALRSDGTVVAWPLGAIQPPAGLTNAVAVAGGVWHVLALRSDGTVVTWGIDRLSNGVTTVPPGLTNAPAIAAGAYFSMALRADGTVVAWGEDSSGQTNVPPDLTNAVAIAAGDSHCLALRSDGTVVAWGADLYGQTDLPPGLTNVVGIAAGGCSSIAVLGVAMPPQQVLVTNVAFGAGGFTATVPTDRMRVYALEYKNSLSDAQWTLLPLVAGTGGAVALSDAAPGPGQRFYRVRRW